MNYYAVCPLCGYKLFKASEGSSIEVYCPKCREKLLIEIRSGKLSVQKVLSNKTETE